MENNVIAKRHTFKICHNYVVSILHNLSKLYVAFPNERGALKGEQGLYSQDRRGASDWDKTPVTQKQESGIQGGSRGGGRLGQGGTTSDDRHG